MKEKKSSRTRLDKLPLGRLFIRKGELYILQGWELDPQKILKNEPVKKRAAVYSIAFCYDEDKWTPRPNALLGELDPNCLVCPVSTITKPITHKDHR